MGFNPTLLIPGNGSKQNIPAGFTRRSRGENTPWQPQAFPIYCLPMNSNKMSRAGQPASAPPYFQPSLRQRILVVEEENDLRQLNAEVLMDAGYQVDAVEDGVAAWAALQLHRYDLLFTGQFLPKLSGVELLKKLHDARTTLPVIMATEILPTWEFALHPCLQSIVMLRKPFTFEKLLGMVNKILHPSNPAHEEVASPSSQTIHQSLVYGHDGGLRKGASISNTAGQ
jgi:CheY-like chemotaxis protein